MCRYLLRPELQLLPSEYNCGAFVAGSYLPTLETKIGRKPRSSAFALFSLRGFLQPARRKPFNCLELFPASILRAEFLQVVLGLLLGVLGAALGVRAGIQLMDGLVQSFGFVANRAFAPGQIRVAVHARTFRPQAVEFHSAIVPTCKRGNAFMQCRERCASILSVRVALQISRLLEL